MLASDKAAGTIALFHRQWLDVTELLEQAKDPAVYPPLQRRARRRDDAGAGDVLATTSSGAATAC